MENWSQVSCIKSRVRRVHYWRGKRMVTAYPAYALVVKIIPQDQIYFSADTNPTDWSEPPDSGYLERKSPV